MTMKRLLAAVVFLSNMLNPVCAFAHENEASLPVEPEIEYHTNSVIDAPCRKIVGVGAGIAGLMNAYLTFKDAQKQGKRLQYVIYEKNLKLSDTTITNIVPSFTPDEILSVVPRGKALVEKLKLRFDEPGGIRVDDVPGIEGSPVSDQFIQSVERYSADEEGHNERTKTLLALGKMSMDLWQQIYDEADEELKTILQESNFNPCREPRLEKRQLHDGYRIDLIYNVPNAEQRALGMKSDYETLGYQHCALLSPKEVCELDPFLSKFCVQHTFVDETTGERRWNSDATALWRPGGCIDARIFIPKLYAYLKRVFGTYTTIDGQQEDCFEVHFGKQVAGVIYAGETEDVYINGLRFADGTEKVESQEVEYVICPGEAVGTLTALGFQEPPYAGFGGASLVLCIPLTEEQSAEFSTFNHCMEVHQEGVVLAWQARYIDKTLFLGVAGTKAFYSDKRPGVHDAFTQNRNLLQLNMLNDVLPEFVSIALGRDTTGQRLEAEDLTLLETQGIAKRWAGVRAVVFDGVPLFGSLYTADSKKKIANAITITALGSGGGSFAPAASVVSNAVTQGKQDLQNDPLIDTVLLYADTRRSAP